MYYAVVENNKVINVIVADADFVSVYEANNPTYQCVEYDEFNEDDTKVARIGELYVDGKFVSEAHPTIVPQSITMRQCRLQLISMGLDDDVEMAIEAITDPTQKKIVRIEWEYATTVDRHNGWIETLGDTFGLTSEQLDQMFVEASGI